MTEPHPASPPVPHNALRVRVRGIVQGVGFRPFVYRLAQRLELRGWVLNDAGGVEIHVEGSRGDVGNFIEELEHDRPPAAVIASIQAASVAVEGFATFEIRASAGRDHPTARISPDLPVCDACLAELFDSADRHHHYPYINCTECGPRYSIVLELPYDRARTTMNQWPMCDDCAREYHDIANRRFHAQPVACPVCGPRYYLRAATGEDVAWDDTAIARAAGLLRDGAIIAIKGLGGYHLACDAHNEEAVRALRERKYRKEQPFAVMVRDAAVARDLVDLTAAHEALLASAPRPIVLAPRAEHAGIAAGVAPGNHELGVMLPYTPLHHMLFAAAAPRALVMTSANRSSEPIAYRDADAFERLSGIADAYLAGARAIARRVDDSVARIGPFGPVILRRSRGYAPGAVARLQATRPILALGADLKNTVALVVDGQAFVSQHIGDLGEYAALESFRDAITDLLAMYDIPADELLVVHDAHPEYASTLHALELPGEKHAVQHHRAHIASVLAERGWCDRPVAGISFDGTGYGDDGSIWGGEAFVGSVANGFERAAHMLAAQLPGGEAAARVPVQAAAGFLHGIEDLPDLTVSPFNFSERYSAARVLVEKGLRTFPTTSVGRLFDTVAALTGFVRPITFEGQAAIWLEQLARRSHPVAAYPFPGLDYRPMLQAVIADRLRNRPVAEIARAFHAAIAAGVIETGGELCARYDLDTLVLSGGVFQNQLLLEEIARLAPSRLNGRVSIAVNHLVPPNDGGISLGQAALGAAWDKASMA